MVRLWLGLMVATTIALASGADAATHKPNIIVIQTDDQNTGTVSQRVMPSVARLLAGPGTTFTDYIDSGPLCCPSRAVMLTGQYGHNNGVMWNEPDPYGDLIGKHNTLPVWLHRDGYVTAHVGKYLNNYERAVSDPNDVAPGWDQWHTALEGATALPYYDYTLRENGRAVDYGSSKADYITRVLNRKALTMIHRYASGPKPLFLALDQVAPHQGPNRDSRCSRGAPLPAPSDLGLFKNAALPMSPAFNEADVSDKPRFVRNTPRLTQDEIDNLQRVNGCRLASMRAVDRGVRHIVRALRREHELKNTAIVYTSDNGFLLGQHRLEGKIAPYEDSLHVPLIVRVPPAARGAHGAPAKLRSTVANVDVAPTILKLAGAKPCRTKGACRTLDGRSLLRAIRTHGRKWRATVPSRFQGLRASDEVYIEYRGVAPPGAHAEPCEPDNEVEHYNLQADPFELDNLFPAPAGTPEAIIEQRLAARVARLSDCAGIKGRDPAPQSGHYCK